MVSNSLCLAGGDKSSQWQHEGQPRDVALQKREDPLNSLAFATSATGDPDTTKRVIVREPAVRVDDREEDVVAVGDVDNPRVLDIFVHGDPDQVRQGLHIDLEDARGSDERWVSPIYMGLTNMSS